jgi:hypothetical protein
LTQAIKTAQVSSSGNKTAQIQAELASTVQDYQKKLGASTAIRNSKPQAVLNDIIKTQADTSAAMARIAKSVGQSHQELVAKSAFDTQITSATTSAMTENIIKVISLFKQMFGSGRQFKDAKVDFNKAVALLLERAVTHLVERDAGLTVKHNEIVDLLVKTRVSLQDLLGAYDQWDTMEQAGQQAFHTWATAQNDTLKKMRNEIEGLNLSEPSIDGVLRKEISDLVSTIESKIIPTMDSTRGAALKIKLEALNATNLTSSTLSSR